MPQLTRRSQTNHPNVDRPLSFSLNEMQLQRHDALFDVQAFLWQQLRLPGGAAAAAAASKQWQQQPLPACLAAARILCLSQAEVEQQLSCAADVQRPLNPRNEAAALALLLQHQAVVCGSCSQRQQELQQLLAAYPASALPAAGHATQPRQPQQQATTLLCDAASPEGALHAWALARGAVSSVLPARFSSPLSPDGGAAAAGGGGLRGCAAAADLPAGALVLQVPLPLLITYDTAAASDFGKALSRLPGLDAESLAVTWTMVERHDRDSPHAPFWAALPAAFGTALSVPEPLFGLMRGLPAYQEAAAARRHVRESFQALQQAFTVLLTAYRAHLQPEWFSESAYLWAVELWYAYAIQVKLPGGAITPALVPYASLLNHSPYPHCVRFSSVSAHSNALEVRSFRRAQQGEQVLLSYGPLPNGQLLQFYAFALPRNPFEQLVLRVGGEAAAAAATGTAKQQLLTELGLGLEHTLSAQRPLPRGLLPCLRVLCASEQEVKELQAAVAGYKQQQQQQQQPAVASSTLAAAGPLQQLTAAWAAAAMQDALLGRPLSGANEAAVQQALQDTLAAARKPLADCKERIAHRQRLQERLGSAPPPGEQQFCGALHVYVQGLLQLLDDGVR